MANKQITEKAYNEAKMRAQQKQRVETLEDLWVVKQHHWNTGAKENYQLNPEKQTKSSSPDHLMNSI